MADPLVWDTPPLPHHAFMLDDMNAFGSGTHRGGMMGWQGVAVVRGSRMIAASEALRGTQSVASDAWARLSMWDGPLRRVGLIRSSAWGGNRLRGTTRGTGIWRDSAGNTTQSWANWTGDIRQAHELLTAAGYQVEAVYILFTHQEADWQTPRADYLTDFLAMKDERETANTTWNKAIRVMSVSKLDKATPYNSWKPYQAWLLNGRYPFVRTIWALLNDPKRGLPWGFAHFIESPKGQLILFKAGLLPTRGEITIRDVQVHNQ
jgi:hypothetical protein